MAYTKTIWASGDTVTSTKLNKIENQLETLSNGGSSLVVTLTWSNNYTVLTANKTYNEIAAALQNGQGAIGYVHISESGFESHSMYWCAGAMYDVNDDNPYQILFIGHDNITLYSSTANGILTNQSAIINV